MARGDKGVNGLDELCKEHDIAYATNKDSSERKEADKKLASGALKRIFSRDATFGERAASLLVTTAMKAKAGLSKFGMGISNRRRQKVGKTTRGKKSFAVLVKDAKAGIKRSKANNVGNAIIAAFRAAKASKGGKSVSVPRIIKVPSISGGVLPLIPIIAGLGAIGSLIGSASGVVRTINNIKNAKSQLEENQRHNRAMELKIGSGLSIGRCRNGSGLYLRPHAKGKGLYLRPNSRGKGMYLKPFSKNYH